MVGAFPCDARLSVPMKERSTTLRTPQPLEPDNPVLKLLDKIGDPNMYIRVLALLAFAFLVLVTPSWAQQSCIGSGDGSPQTCNITFSPGNTTGTFDFSATGDGVITFQFDTVLTTFELIVSANEVASITNLDPTEFPTGTVC